MMNSVSLKIFKYILFFNISNIKLLVNEIEISEKKLRYELLILREYIEKNKFGELQISKGEVIINLNYELDYVYQSIKNNICLDSIERQDYIFFKLLSEEKISLNKISEELNISKVTCRRDLYKLSESFNENIRIKLDKSYYLTGNEIEIRKKGIDVIVKYLDSNIKKIIGNNFEILNYKIYDFLSILKADMTGNSYLIMYAYLFITLIRVKNNNFILTQNIKLNKENEKIYKQIKENINKISLELNTDKEILQILDLYINLMPNKAKTFNYTEEFFVELEIKKFIYRLSKRCNIKFYEDIDLVEGITNHLSQAIYRANIGIQLLDVNLIDENEMPMKLFKAIEIEIKSLEDVFSIRFSKQELLLFVVHFQASLEKKENSDKKTNNILLLCVGGYGTTKILVNKLNERYEINNIVIISKLDLFKINFKDYDMLISTINYSDLKLGIKTLKISPLITSNEIQKLDQYFKIKNKDKQYKKTKYSNKLKIFNNNNIFYVNFKINKWEDVIYYGVEKMKNLGIVDLEYYDKLVENIKKYGPYMVISEGIAIPHAICEKENYKSGYIAVYLKYPVLFPKNKKVKLLFFMYSKYKNDNKNIIENILRILQNNNINEIKNKKTLRLYLNEENIDEYK